MNIVKKRTLLIEGSKLNILFLLPVIIIGALILIHDQSCIANASTINDLLQNEESITNLNCLQPDYVSDMAGNYESQLMPDDLSIVDHNGKSNEEDALYAALSPPLENRVHSSSFLRQIPTAFINTIQFLEISVIDNRLSLGSYNKLVIMHVTDISDRNGGAMEM